MYLIYYKVRRLLHVKLMYSVVEHNRSNPESHQQRSYPILLASAISLITQDFGIQIQILTMGFPTGNFSTDLPIYIGIAAGITIAATIIVCAAAHFGPRLCGMGRKEAWLAEDVEKQAFDASGRGNAPLMAGQSNHPQW
ncbi:hypothetical protein F4808DRAFT_238828 [Astrocystis sublimbata]|nr:hypothetical protein F4808DRAFT_238828 [Astrocystis sublimbata]